MSKKDSKKIRYFNFIYWMFYLNPYFVLFVRFYIFWYSFHMFRKIRISWSLQHSRFDLFLLLFKDQQNCVSKVYAFALLLRSLPVFSNILFYSELLELFTLWEFSAQNCLTRFLMVAVVRISFAWNTGSMFGKR